ISSQIRGRSNWTPDGKRLAPRPEPRAGRGLFSGIVAALSAPRRGSDGGYTGAALASAGGGAMSEPSLPEDAIFAQALERIADGLRRFLGRPCGGPPAGREGAAALLRARGRGGALLALPDQPAATVDETPVGETPGACIGPYKLLEQIGEGGFGVVFLAEQQ